MHVAGCAIFEGHAPGYDELVEQIVVAAASRPPLPPAAGVRAVRAGPAGVGRRPALQRPLPRAPHGAAAARAATSSSSGCAAGCSPRRSIAPVRCGSCGWSRGSPMIASRSCPRPTTRSSTASPASTSRPCCSTPRPIPRRSRRPSTSGSRGRCRATPSCWPTRCWSARPSRPRSSAACARRCAGPRQVADRARRRRLAASARWRGPGCSGAPPSPLNVRIGPHRRFTWVRGDLAAVQGRSRTRSAAPSTTSCWRPSPAASGRYLRRRGRADRRHRAARDGPGLGPRRRRARGARQPRRGDVGAAAGRR